MSFGPFDIPQLFRFFHCITMDAYILALQLLDSLDDGVFVFQLAFHDLLEFGCDFRMGLLYQLFPHIGVHSLHGQCDFEFAIFTAFLYFTFQIALLDLADAIPFRA